MKIWIVYGELSVYEFLLQVQKLIKISGAALEFLSPQEHQKFFI